MSEPRSDIPTGASRFICANCEREIIEVQDPYSYVLDYGDNGDFGCDSHPLSNEDGTYGHVPDIARGMVSS